MENKWFAMERKSSALEIDLFDEIGGFGINAADFKRDLDDMDEGGEIRVSINSPGGSVFDGIAIYSLLAERRERVSVHVYGLAASIASVIALAGKELTMADGTFFMIHDPWSVTLGTADEHRKTADILDKIADQIISIYQAHTALTDEELAMAMRDETWFSPEEAVEAGFAHGVVGERVAAMVRHPFMDRFRRVPSEITEQAADTAEEEAPMEAKENAQAAAESAPATNEVNAKVDALETKLEEIQQKMASVSVQPQVRPSLKDEGAQWFYDSLREATATRGNFKASADAITTSDGMGIPVAASEQILMNVNQMSILRRYGAEVRPAGAQSTRFSTVVDSGAAGLISEGGSYSEKADPTLITMALYKLGGRFSLTEEADEDTFMDMYAAFSRYAGRLIARAENAYFLSGSGSSQPTGIDEETAAVTAAGTGAITFAELIELDESLDPEWRWYNGNPFSGEGYQGPIYVCSASTAEALRVLQDSNSNYFFRNHEESGMTTLFGKPLIRNSNIADMEASAVSLALVHPAAYLIGERRPNLALKVGYDNDTHNVTWDFNERVGGQVWDSNGVKVLAMAAS